MRLLKYVVFAFCLVLYGTSYAQDIEVSGQIVVERSPCGMAKKDQNQPNECSFPLKDLDGLRVEFILDQTKDNPNNAEKIFYATIDKEGQFKTSLPPGTFLVQLDRSIRFASSEKLPLNLKENVTQKENISLKIGILFP